jgi:uncharacterized membrane protein HdeD (DUF308 family)
VHAGSGVQRRPVPTGGEARVNRSTSWVVAAVGVVLAVVGVVVRMTTNHHTIGLGLVVLGVIALIVGVVMALRSSKSE